MHKKTRLCKSCGTKLSAYNDEVLCDTCLVNPSDVTKALREMKGIANGKPSKDDQ
jgi:NMD protein affecting ribosome stability and mRNA decay